MVGILHCRIFRQENAHNLQKNCFTLPGDNPIAGVFDCIKGVIELTHLFQRLQDWAIFTSIYRYALGNFYTVLQSMWHLLLQWAKWLQSSVSKQFQGHQITLRKCRTRIYSWTKRYLLKSEFAISYDNSHTILACASRQRFSTRTFV